MAGREEKSSERSASKRRQRAQRRRGRYPPEGGAGPDAGATPEASEEAEQLRDRLLRLQADQENARKRQSRQREEQAKFAVEGLMKEIIVAIDNFDRALEHRAHTPEVEAFAKGLELTHRHLWEVLSKHGLARTEALGKPFDPHIHEAMATEEAAGVDDGTVLEVLQEGYTLHGRVLRPALVKVAKAAEG